VEGRLSPAAPEPLGARHDAGGFDCGVPALDGWPLRAAGAGPRAAAFVACDGGRVVGFYALWAGTVRNAEGSVRVRRNTPVPILKLGRLAVDRTAQGRGLGTALVMDAFLRTYAVSRRVPVAALTADAPEAVAGWLRGLGFKPVPGDAAALFVALGTIEALVEHAVPSA
jgi:GNAT superfamily N-acetyltransferase